jgi:ferric-dicitrate binding protein FerR (iron transport regulator)
MNKYIGKIINLYTKSKVGEPARTEFHKWLVNKQFAEEKENALFSLWNRTEAAEKTEILSETTAIQRKKKNIPLIIWRYATAIVLIVCISSAYIFTRNEAAGANIIEHYSRAGQSKTITLPDGSTVLANSGSIILYSKSFGENTRTLYLSGEANFKVQKNKDIPFIVKSKGFSVTAIGTEFDISTYPEDNFFKATLINGVVKVKQDDSEADYILKPADQLFYDKQSEQISITQTDLNEAIAWQRGELVFRGATVKEVLNVLERKYAVSFQYKSDTLDDDKFNFRFKKESSLSEVLNIIKEVAEGFNYNIINNMYYIN